MNYVLYTITGQIKTGTRNGRGGRFLQCKFFFMLRTTHFGADMHFAIGLYR